MAQDLSQTIQEGLAQALTDSLGIDAKFLETTKLDIRDVQDNQLLEVNSIFEFDKLETTFQFIIPATTASIIFNNLMGTTDAEISKTIDDDLTDSMSEFVSSVSGSLVTAFNAKGEEELGNAKFHIQNKKTVEGSELVNIENVYRFSIELEDTPLNIFIQFNENFFPFIDKISKSEPTFYPEEESSNEENKQEEVTETITHTQEKSMPEESSNETSEQPKTDEDSQTNEETDSSEEVVEDEESLKKAKKMKILIIALSSLIGLVLIIFLVIFFMSDPEENTPTENTEQVQEDTQEKKAPEEIKITTTKTLKKIDFNIKDIDVARLNGRLATLTKYEILTKEELQEQQKEEAKRLERLKKEEALKEFAKLNKEEPVVVKEPVEEKPKEVTKEVIEPQKTVETKIVETVKKEPVIQEKIEEVKEVKKEKPTQVETKIVQEKVEPLKEELIPSKQLYISTKSIKYTLFKSLIPKLNSTTVRISMCNDDSGRTVILIGPFENIEHQNLMGQYIQETKENIQTSSLELSQEEFTQKCNF
jgi:hypothetical protein